MTLTGGQERKIGIALVLCFVLALGLPYLEVRILSSPSQFMGWQIWLISFYVFSGSEIARYFFLPLLSAASIMSLLLSVGLIVQRWRWINAPQWPWFSLMMCLGYVAAPLLLDDPDPAHYLIGYYLGLVFHALLTRVLFSIRKC